MDSNASRASRGAELTAIDVLLEPDATMVSKAEAANARLRENFPGYALDALHAPHITVLQRHVRTRDLDSMYLAVRRVFETEHLADLPMKATGYYYIPFTEKGASMGLAGIVIEPSADLLRLRQEELHRCGRAVLRARWNRSGLHNRSRERAPPKAADRIC